MVIKGLPRGSPPAKESPGQDFSRIFPFLPHLHVSVFPSCHCLPHFLEMMKDGRSLGSIPRLSQSAEPGDMGPGTAIFSTS